MCLTSLSVSWKGILEQGVDDGHAFSGYMCGINNDDGIPVPETDYPVPTPCPNFHLGPPSPTGFYMIALKAATAAIVAIYAKTSFRKSALFIASTDFSSKLTLVFTIIIATIVQITGLFTLN